MTIQTRHLVSRFLFVCLLAATSLGGRTHAQSAATPNILFIIMDDLGVDQLSAFNPAAGTAALTPNLNAIAAAGVKFTNFYTMPECSPSRVAFFTGRYPFRNGVTAAILDQDLPAAQISPFEVTTPKVLAAHGYRSAMIGKYHLGGPENNPDGVNAPLALGWNHFDGNLRGAADIDTSLGGQYTRDKDKYSCGFPTGTERGAVWFQSAGRQAQCDDNQGAGYTGHQGITLGGIPALDAQGVFARTCREAAGSGPDFTKLNGYYVWPQAAGDDSSRIQTSTSRKFMTTAQTDAAIAWVRAQSAGADRRPWMATVSYNMIHTPYQQPPLDLYPSGFVWPPAVPQNCTGSAAIRVLSDLMLASLDQEIGRLLVSVGLASRGDGGQLVYRPEFNDTMVVIVGDNGTYLSGVKAPYDPTRAKGTVYQTGVSTPLIVSGPEVVGKGRTVAHMVNAVDLFILFSEISRPPVDLSVVVPRSHALDGQGMLAYLRDPDQRSLRRTNFTQVGKGLKASTVTIYPCVLRIAGLNIATEIFTNQGLCETEGGTWFGPTAAQPNPLYPTSCAVRAAGLYSNLTILPVQSWVMRNSRYKLVRVERAPCDAALGEFELYDLTPNPPSNPLGLDLASTNLLANGQPVTRELRIAFDDLRDELYRLLDSERVCEGDGNLDKRVDASDVQGVNRYMGQPSVFDFNHDGVTGPEDLQFVLSRVDTYCR